MPKSAGAKYTMPEPTPQDLARAVSGITDRVAELEASIPRLPHYLRPAFVSDLPPAKGSILVWDGTSLKWIRVLVGSNGQALTADSTASAGVAWAAGGVSMKMPESISSHSLFSCGPVLAANAAAAPASATWSAANRALYLPFIVTETITIVKLWVLNGATASENIDMGIYNPTGVRQVSIGSTAQSGTSDKQEFDIADTVLTAGIWYLGIAKDGILGTVFASSGGQALLSAGAYIQASAFALPATATFATASGFTIGIPVCGMSTRLTV